MAMTKVQQTYALSKISTIVAAKVSETKEAEGWPRVSLSTTDKHQLIVEGKVKVKKDFSDTPHYHSPTSYFDFSKYEKKAGISKKGQARLDLLSSALEKAKDEVMLGDSSEALALLSSIEKL